MPFRAKIPQIGEPIPRRDAPDKVAGRALYAADHYGKGLLWAGAKRAPIPHGRIKAILTENAMAIPGVIAVLTHKDVKGTNRQGVIRKDQPVLADQEVRHRGDAVALVVAQDRETLARAIDRITVDMEPLEAVFDPEEAMKPGAVLVHPERPEGNCLLKGEIETGSGAKALYACDVVVEADFRLPWQEHAYLETESGWAMADGTFHALEVRVVYDTGPYDHLGGAVMALGLEHAGGPYRIPNTSLKAWAVYTNNPVGGAFRGFGVPQVAAAMEQAVDMLAARLSISPLELRLRNGVTRGDRTPVGGTLTGSTGLLECLETVKGSRLWTNRETWKRSAGPFKRRGVGLSCVIHGMGYGPVVPDVANAKIELTKEGKFRIFSGIVDMGQGNSATYLQIADEVFIGACTTHATLLDHPVIRKDFPILATAISLLGSPPVRNMGTIGGNLATASPAGDTLPPLYALGAEVEILRKEGSRRMGVAQFIRGPGETALLPGEILSGIWLNKDQGFHVHHYEKVGQRKAQAIALVSLAALLRINQDRVVEAARFAWGSVGPTVVTSSEADGALVGKPLCMEGLEAVAAVGRRVVSPIDDLRASAAYRRTVAGNLVLRLSCHSSGGNFFSPKLSDSPDFEPAAGGSLF
jgi:CO/xanthine dehydrogenase FAD-binding subunit